MAEVVFWFIVLLTLSSAVMVVHSQNLVYSAIALLFTFLGVAGLYIFLWADFLAAVQVLIYIGGILVLIIFGIMLTNRITSVTISHTSVQRSLGGIIVLGVFVLLGLVITRTPWLQQASEAPESTIAAIGNLLMMDYLLPFEVASLLLLGALIGAAMLSRRRNT
jgi:NADH-quinone oxidoreductase subunit J